MTRPGDKSFLERKSLTQSRQNSYLRAWETFSILGEGTQVARDDCESVGSSDVRLYQPDVFRRLGHFRSPDLSGRHQISPGRCGESNATVQVCAGSSRVHQIGTASGSPSHAILLCMIVQELWERHREVSLWLLLVWGTCARPGEAFRVLVQDIVPPTKLCSHDIVVLNSGRGLARNNSSPSNPRQTSKVGESDEAVMIDQPYLGSLGKFLLELGKNRSPIEPFFNFNMKQGTELFEKIIAKHQLVNHGLNCTYQPRHGSTSTDVLTQHRSLVEVQKRGRWETTKSVRRYSNGGRISQVFNGLPEETKNLA